MKSEESQSYGLEDAEAIANTFKVNRIDGRCFSEMTVERCFALGIPYGAASSLVRDSTSGNSMLFEDFEGLLNNTMMTAALLLSFSVTLHTGSKSLDDFSEADERRFRLFIAGGALDVMQTSDITSYKVNLYGCQAVSYFTLVLIIGYSASISLYLSTARNDPDLLEFLSYPYKLVLGVCFVLMILGLQALFNLNWALVDVIYPIYNGDVPVANWFDPASESIVEAIDVGYGKFTWVTQRVVSTAVAQLNICFIVLPITIVAGTYLLYGLWTCWPGRSRLQTVLRAPAKPPPQITTQP